MRTKPTPLILLATWCGLLQTDAAAADAADHVGKVVVRKIVGAGRWTQDETWRALVVGDQLTPGSIVRTGSESRVELTIPDDGITFSLLEDSTINLDKLNSEKIKGVVVCNHTLGLKAGRLEVVVSRLAPTSKFEVKVPEGVIGVRGNDTRFSLAADFSLSVGRGSVVLVYVNKEKSGKDILALVVNAGERFNPASLKVEPIGK